MPISGDRLFGLWRGLRSVRNFHLIGAVMYRVDTGSWWRLMPLLLRA
jgi:hypothetical protein